MRIPLNIIAVGIPLNIIAVGTMTNLFPVTREKMHPLCNNNKLNNATNSTVISKWFRGLYK